MTNNLNLETPLSNMQLELLKLYGKGVPEEYLEDLKVLIARYLFARARAKANQIWDEKGYSDQIIDDLLAGQNG